MRNQKLKINVSQYIADTAHLGLTEHGVYLRLILHYYQNDSWLPDDLDNICRIVCAVTTHERRVVADILDEFFVLTATPIGNEWRHTKTYIKASAKGECKDDGQNGI